MTTNNTTTVAEFPYISHLEEKGFYLCHLLLLLYLYTPDCYLLAVVFYLISALFISLLDSTALIDFKVLF